ncbi:MULTISPECIES: hypothetical protein [unclassified Glutamicibacter]|uniref:hypothetical protein n=1 Tax=unclassified Glutamicibacter TaxID=2627139 RepID=UPI0038008C54
MSERRGGCPTTGKAMFTTRNQAKQFRRRKEYRDQHIYKCTHCGYFHMGGTHGEQSRHAHRNGIGMTPIPEAAQMLAVSQTVIRLIIQSGKAHGDDNNIRTEDLNKLQKAMYQT